MGGVNPVDLVVNDDLSDVLNNATLVEGPTTCGDAACTVQAGTASISGTTLTWTVPVLSQPFVYVEYTVRVNPDAYGVTLKNQVTSPGSTPCVPENSEDVSTDRFASRALLTGPQAFSAAAVNAAVRTTISARRRPSTTRRHGRWRRRPTLTPGQKLTR